MDVIASVKWGEMKESSNLYTSEAVDALLSNEREKTIQRENEIKDLIHDNDDVFDDMISALDPVVDLPDFNASAIGTFTMIDLANRVNVITNVLKTLRQGLLD